MRFGYGIGVAYPPIWLETPQISHGFETPLEPGMVFVLHACIELADEGLGVVQGGTCALTDSGLDMLVGGATSTPKSSDRSATGAGTARPVSSPAVSGG